MSEVSGRDRLEWIGDLPPVVKGTRVTARHVISLIVDGWTYHDILRVYPDLDEADIRACLAWAQSELKVDLRYV